MQPPSSRLSLSSSRLSSKQQDIVVSSEPFSPPLEEQDFVRTSPLFYHDCGIPDAQSDVHLRGCGVLRHITNHSGSAQDYLADGCSHGRVPHVAKATPPSSNR